MKVQHIHIVYLAPHEHLQEWNYLHIKLDVLCFVTNSDSPFLFFPESFSQRKSIQPAVEYQSYTQMLFEC